MKNDNTRANHRGSSPPFQDPVQDFYDWLNGLASIGKHDESASANQIARRPGKGKTITPDPNNGGSRQGRDDESRRRDDGGSGG
jgi:hypothetical protein